MQDYSIDVLIPVDEKSRPQMGRTEDGKKVGFWDPVSGSKMAAQVYSTWPNPPGPEVQIVCVGCDQDRWVAYVDYRVDGYAQRRPVCRNCRRRVYGPPPILRDRC